MGRLLARLALAGAAVLVVAGCGTTATSSPVATTTPTGPAGTTPSTTTSTAPVGVPAGAVRLVAADNEHTATVVTGHDVVVTLATGDLWAEPVSSDSSVLRRIGGGVDTTTGAATATFSAVAAGSVRLRSTHRCLPVKGRACGQYIALWTVTVTVS